MSVNENEIEKPIIRLLSLRELLLMSVEAEQRMMGMQDTSLRLSRVEWVQIGGFG